MYLQMDFMPSDTSTIGLFSHTEIPFQCKFALPTKSHKLNPNLETCGYHKTILNITSLSGHR